MAEAEIYGGEGGRQTLQQQLVQSQLAGVPMERATLLASQAIAAREAGYDTLADSIEGMITDIQTPTGDNGDDTVDPLRSFVNALGTDKNLQKGTRFTIMDGTTRNESIPPDIAKELGQGNYIIDANGNIRLEATGGMAISKKELQERLRDRIRGS